MPDTNYDNCGRLFKNDRKSQEKHPDYRGDAIIGGVEYSIAAWIKVNKKYPDGSKWMFIRFEKI